MNYFIGILLKYGSLLILYIPNSDVTHTTKSIATMKSGVVTSHKK